MSEKDKAVVDAYARVGMSLDTLIMSFPQFSPVDVTSVYEDYRKAVGKYEDDLHSGVSRNCS